MELPRALSERYSLEERIGAGGAGDVWRAADRTLSRTVAIKVLRPELERDPATVERFRREATAAAALTHPNAVVIYDIREHDGELYLVMEHVDGPSLADLLRGRPLEPDLVAALGCQVASAIAAAHEQGLIHRDVKPANILLTRQGVAKVADFGIAKAIGDTDARLTSDGQVVGTAAYLAPEQLQGGDIDPRVDVYALGLLLHECLTGAPPFTGGTAAEIAARRLTNEVPPVTEARPDVPEDLDLVIRKATRIDRDERFDDATSLAAVLARLSPDDASERLARFVAAAGAPPGDTDRTMRLDAAVADRVRTARPGEMDETQVVTGGPSGTDAVDAADGDTDDDDTDEVPGGPRATQVVGSPAADREPRVDTAPPPRRSGPPAPTATPTGEGPVDRDSRSRRPTWVLAAVVGVALVAAFVLGGSDDGNGDGSGGEPVAISPAAAQDFDPHSDAGEEHREDVPKAFDGDPGTAWVTERYNSSDLGGLKPGVGIWFDLGAPRALRSLELTVSPGIAFSVYAGGEQPTGTDPAAWGTEVAAIDGAEGTVPIEVPDEVGEARYWLVWITDVGSGRAEIAEATFTAR